MRGRDKSIRIKAAITICDEYIALKRPGRRMSGVDIWWKLCGYIGIIREALDFYIKNKDIEKQKNAAETIGNFIKQKKNIVYLSDDYLDLLKIINQFS